MVFERGEPRLPPDLLVLFTPAATAQAQDGAFSLEHPSHYTYPKFANPLVDWRSSILTHVEVRMVGQAFFTHCTDTLPRRACFGFLWVFTFSPVSPPTKEEGLPDHVSQSLR